MAYAKLAGKLLKYAFKPGIRKSIIKSPLAKRGTLSKMAMKRIKPQALINPNAKRLTKPQMLKGLKGETRKLGEKRWDKTQELGKKATERRQLLHKGLAEKVKYEKVHGVGTYEKFQKAQKKAGIIKDKERIKKLVQRDKEARKAGREIKVRDLTETRSEFKDLKIQPEGARHHIAGVNTSAPIFENLPYKDAQDLRKYAREAGQVEFGDLLKNLKDVPGTVKHALGNLHNAKLHPWLKKVGIDTPPKVSPDAPYGVRAKIMQQYIFDVKRQLLKYQEILAKAKGQKIPKDLTPIENLFMIKPSLPKNLR